MRKQYVLDACGLIAFLSDEIGASVIEEVFYQAHQNSSISVNIHKVNLLEVYYHTYNLENKDIADNILAEIQKLPIHVEDSISDEHLKEAGRLKSTYKISLADSIALSYTIILDGAIITSDHHEFDVIEGSESIDFLWIR